MVSTHHLAGQAARSQPGPRSDAGRGAKGESASPLLPGAQGYGLRAVASVGLVPQVRVAPGHLPPGQLWAGGSAAVTAPHGHTAQRHSPGPPRGRHRASSSPSSGGRRSKPPNKQLAAQLSIKNCHFSCPAWAVGSVQLPRASPLLGEKPRNLELHV